jgi:hypothetical protein
MTTTEAEFYRLRAPGLRYDGWVVKVEERRLQQVRLRHVVRHGQGASYFWVHRTLLDRAERLGADGDFNYTGARDAQDTPDLANRGPRRARE